MTTTVAITAIMVVATTVAVTVAAIVAVIVFAARRHLNEASALVLQKQTVRIPVPAVVAVFHSVPAKPYRDCQPFG